MIGLPEIGARVRVWPTPGRRVQNGPRPVDAMGGGRLLPAAEGADVIWTEFHLEQYRTGDLSLHPPACDEHDFGKDGELDNCSRCGRDSKAATKYDDDVKVGRKALEEDRAAAKAAVEKAAAEKAAAEKAAAAPPPATSSEQG